MASILGKRVSNGHTDMSGGRRLGLGLELELGLGLELELGLGIGL